jgi:hypothetical protein
MTSARKVSSSSSVSRWCFWAPSSSCRYASTSSWPESIRTGRHATVHGDHREVAGQSDHHQEHPGHPNVDERERDEERVGEREDRRPDDEIGSAGAFRHMDELDPQAEDHETPPARPKGFEPVQAPVEHVPEEHGDDDDGEQQLHG